MPKIRKITAATKRIHDVGKTRVKAPPIATAMPAVSKKANKAPERTDIALKREDNVMTAICVLSPNSAIVTSTNDATIGVKFMDKEDAFRLY